MSWIDSPRLGVPVPAYLLVGVDRGEEFCGVPPEDALPVIRGRGRTPLTIDEGIALVTIQVNERFTTAVFKKISKGHKVQVAGLNGEQATEE